MLNKMDKLFFFFFLVRWDMSKEYGVSMCVLKENFQKVAC